ncbi:MAG: hypothetical protein SH859_01565 [Hyphomicrobium aestuarii]|nr:hypothetical protein [Hyphomicrobium aestuarii]
MATNTRATFRATIARPNTPDHTPTPRDVEAMAAVLEAKHGAHAAEVADFFSNWYDDRGDAGRSWAWAGVADTVRIREQERLGESNIF